MKVLFFGETPCIITGTALLSRNILKFLTELGHTVEMVGINHHDDVKHDEELYPFKIHRCPVTDAYNIEKAREMIKNAEYDLLFLSSDVSQIRSEERRVGKECRSRG